MIEVEEEQDTYQKLNEDEAGEEPTGLSDPSWRHLDKQISAFDSLVRQAASRQSVPAVHAAFQHALDCPFSGTPRRVASNVLVAAQEPVDSVAKLRDLLHRLRRRTGKSTSDTKICTDLEVYLKDIQVMKGLKKYFDEKIYCILYQYFYNPLNTTLVEGSEPVSDLIDDEDGASSVNGDGGGGIFLTETQQPDSTNGQSKRTHKLELFEKCVSDLYSVNQKWEVLVSLDELTSANFEQESAKSVDNLEATDQFYWLLRLMTDLLVKCEKCSKLTREWLTLYNDLRESDLIANQNNAHSGRRPSEVHPINLDNIEQGLQKLTNQLTQRDTAIRHVEHALDIHVKEFEFLEGRVERVHVLMTSCEKMAAHLRAVGERYKGLIQKRQEALHRLENTVQGTQRYKDISEDLRQYETNLVEQYKELKMAEYGLEVAETDCQVEADAAPSFVIFAETERERIERLKTDLVKLRASREKLQSRVTQIRTNHARMMEVLGPREKPEIQAIRPLTNATYTICRISDDRYSTKAESSVASVPEEVPSPRRPAPIQAPRNSDQPLPLTVATYHKPRTKPLH